MPTDFELKCEQQGAPGPAEEGQQQGEGKQAAASGPADGCTNGAAPTAAADSAAFPSPPSLLLDAPGLRLWHKLDRSFRQPRTNAYLRLHSAAGYESPRAAALSHLLIKLLDDALCETAYLAEVAGLHYGIWWEGAAGLDLKLHGFSHKLPALARFIAASLAGLRVQPEAFARVKEALLRNYRNVNMNVSKHATYQRLLALKDRFWHADEVLPQLEGLQPGDVQDFLPTMLAGLHIEALLHGNITAQEAEALARQVEAG